jgi:L,D-transpeptidase catalytic domain
MRRRALLAAVTTALCAASAAPAAWAAPDFLTSTESRLAGTTLSLAGRGDAELLHRVKLRGRVPIPGPDQWVTVTIWREGKVIRTRTLRADPATGAYRMRVRLKGCCRYVARAVHGSDVSNSVPFQATVPAELEGGTPQTLLFNRLLRRAGYHMPDELSDQEDWATGLAVMAMRKTLDLTRTESYHPDLFELLLRGEGGFEPVHTEEGRHVEVDVSRQVMALVEDGKATDVFHVSTGAGGTPTGEWQFYSYGPGYNAKGMYYSIYYDGNYATHGYSSVPTYPASHGCTRNPIPYSVFIYDWIDLGDTIYVYY